MAGRLRSVAPSLIRSISAGAPPGAVSLALGEPSWPMHPIGVDALRGAMQPGGACSYGPNGGISELVGALRHRYAVTAESLMITAGSEAALFALFQAHVDPGTRVLVPDPGFPAYRTLAALAGADVSAYPLGPGGNLDPDSLLGVLHRHASPPVSLVVLNHPSNPTGGTATLESLGRVAQACERQRVPLVSDEVYRALYAPDSAPSLRDVSSRGIVVESVSKAWAGAGLRVGWATGPADLLAPARLVHTAMNTAPARPSQVAAAALLNASASVLAASRTEVARRWDVAASAASTLCAAGSSEREGMYLWVPLPTSVEDPMGFVVELRDDHKVVVVPGEAFGQTGERYIRGSVGGPVAELATGLQRLTDALAPHLVAGR